MAGYVGFEALAARLEVPLAAIEAMAAAASFPIAVVKGRRFLRLRDAGRIVMAIDPVGPHPRRVHRTANR